MFARADAFSVTYPRIQLGTTTSIAMTNSQQLAIGNYVRETGTVATLSNNTGSATAIFTVNGVLVKAFCVNYTILRGTTYRTGTLTVATSAADSTGDLNYSDDYVENNQTGINLTVTEASDTVSVRYTSTNTGTNATITYSITHLA
jgi:hypothetical protein